MLFLCQLLLLVGLLNLTLRDSLSSGSLLLVLGGLLLLETGLLGVLLSGGHNLHKLLNLGL